MDAKHDYSGRTMLPVDTPSGVRRALGMKHSLIPVILIGSLGVILLLWGSRLFPSCGGTDPGNDGAPPEADLGAQTDAYRIGIEGRIRDICSKVTGAGEVSVIVTLDGGFRQVYAVEEKAGAAGVTRTYVTVGSGSSESAVFITCEAPSVSGIGIVCTGGNDPDVKREITSLLSAAFSLGSNRIYVTGRN